MSSQEQSSQSLTISGNLTNVQLGGQAGRDLNVSQSQNVGQTEDSQILEASDVLTLLENLQDLLKDSEELTDEVKAKAIRKVESAKDEISACEPDKEYAVKSLEKAAQVLSSADAATNLWVKAKPILEKIAPWFGVAISFL